MTGQVTTTGALGSAAERSNEAGVGLRRGLAVLGSTGSVGTQALDVVRAHPDLYSVVALAAGNNAELLQAQAAEFGVDPALARCCAGDPNALAELAAHPDADIVLNAVVGFAGLPATLATVAAGKRLALANKESLIAAGPVVRAARAPGSEIVPVDSEHSAVYQALQAGPRERVRSIVLTASGGPFLGRSRAELANVTLADALAHPTWSMGPKITIDSSTLMNKGLEVIEAHELFGIAMDDIEVVIHPQSIVHGMVTFTDGATVAQLSMPDMRLPISYALAAPGRDASATGLIDWRTLGALTFQEPDRISFPCLDLAYAAGRTGAGAPAALNAANEVANEAFRDGAISWRGIGDVVDEVLNGYTPSESLTIEAVMDIDRRARAQATQAVARRAAA